eukprot:8454355-Pyramimonas_sp.AAC.1
MGSLLPGWDAPPQAPTDTPSADLRRAAMTARLLQQTQCQQLRALSALDLADSPSSSADMQITNEGKRRKNDALRSVRHRPRPIRGITTPMTAATAAYVSAGDGRDAERASSRWALIM